MSGTGGVETLSIVHSSVEGQRRQAIVRQRV
jgi:hypothetical protein